MKQLFYFLLLLAITSSTTAQTQEQQITFTTTKTPGETIRFQLQSTKTSIEVSYNGGTTKQTISGSGGTYTITIPDSGQTVILYNPGTYFNCSNNQLTNLDVTNNAQLTDLNCYLNQLSTLDLTSNTQLQYLYCNNNQLSSLDLTNNTQLQELGCNSNQLSNLNLASNTQLYLLYCDYNQLSTLDLTNNTQLQYLLCNKNRITFDYFEQITNGELINNLKTNPSFFYAPQTLIPSLSKSGNTLSTDRTEGGTLSKLTYKWYSQKGSTQDPSTDEALATTTGNNQYTLTSTSEKQNIYAIVTHEDWTISGNNNKNLSFTTATYSQPLPVAYVQLLKAVQQGNAVLLSWATGTESNNKGFAVQRSTDGSNFATIGFVAARGTNSSYTFTDNGPAKGANLYRLLQQDLNGASVLGNTVSLTIDAGSNGSSIYPNPAGNVINVTASGFVIIYDISGRKVLSQTVNGTKAIDISRLAKGAYILKTGGQSIRFIKQ